MDWSRLERDVKFQTASILQSKPSSNIVAYDSSSRPSPSYRSFENGPRDEKRTLHDSNTDLFEDRRNDEIWSEMQELRNIVIRQNEQIRRLEDEFDSRDASKVKLETMQQRVDQLEADIQSCTKLLTVASRDSADFVVQTKTISGRLHWVEDMVRSSSQDFVSKSAFSQFLDTCTAQLKTIHVSTETARADSGLCLTFIESLLAAFSQLQGTQQILGLEHLVNLSGERQRGQITQHLREALQGAILREVDAGCRGVHARVGDATSDIRKDVSAAMNEIKDQIIQHGQAMADEVYRSAEATNKSLLDSTRQLERVKQRLEADINAVKETQQVADIDQSELRQELKKTTEATSKLVAVTLPTAQRNHKALLDEVLRLEELAGELCHRMDRSEAHAKQLEKLNKQVVTAQPAAAAKPLVAPPAVAAPAMVKMCEMCGELEPVLHSVEGRVSSLDDLVGRLTVTCRSLETGMDALQAEFSTVYDDAEKRKEAFAECKEELTGLRAEVRDLSVLKNNMAELATIKSDIMQLKVKLSNVPLDVFPKTTIQSSAGGARAGLTGLSERIKHSQITTSERTTPAIESLRVDPSVDVDMKASPSPEHVPPLDAPQRCNKDASSDDESYNLSTSDDDNDGAASNRHAGGAAPVDVITATVSSTYNVSSDSDSSFEKSDLLEDRLVAEGSDGSVKPADVVTLVNAVVSDALVHDDDMLDEDDGSSVHLEDGGAADMRETSRIMEDSLDESIQSFDEEHKRILQTQSSALKEGEVLLPPTVAAARPTRTVVKITNASKYESHKRSHAESPAVEPLKEDHPHPVDEGKPASASACQKSESAGATPVQKSGPKLLVDSLGNIVSNKPKSADAVVGGESAGVMKGPSTAILSGSLLGSGGRNKSVPVPKSEQSLHITKTGPSTSLPIPPPTARSEETAQCTFCLRRMGIEDMRAHMKVCELRTELCRFGCRSRIMVSKMDKHVEICPNNPANKDN